jgi:hydrophobic/amphiphilic exporter-1 (mainly G- bacteria), HAE1 family
MSLTALIISRRTSVIAATLACVLIGSVTLARLPVSLLPDVSVPLLTIRTSYPGAGAVQASRLVAQPIEESVASTPRLLDLRSSSRADEIITTMTFEWGTDMRATVLNVRERLDNARDALPAGAARPTLLVSEPSARPIAVLAMAPASSEAFDLGTFSDKIRGLHARRLAQLDGVASISIVGNIENEIRVDLDPMRLTPLGLTLDDVLTSLEAANVVGATGTVRKGQFQFPVRLLTEFTELADIGSTPIGASRTGARLQDVGSVRVVAQDTVTLARLDGLPAVGLVVYKDAGANTVEVSHRLEAAIRSLKTEHPEISITTVTSQASLVIDALTNLGQEIVIGGALSLLVILAFLKDWRVSLAIGVVVPLSVFVALSVLRFAGVTINIFSLGGLALGTGLLVDTAIVVTESIGRKLTSGVARHAAVIEGVDEVAFPLLTGTVTTVLVFGPIMFVEGLGSALFRDLALSVVATVSASLVLSLTALPAFIAWGTKAKRGSMMLSSEGRYGIVQRRDRFKRIVSIPYERMVLFALRHPRGVGLTTIAVCSVTAFITSRMPVEVLPFFDEGVISARLQLADEVSFDTTLAYVQRLNDAASDLGSRGIYARVGRATNEELLSGADPGSRGTAAIILPVPPSMTSRDFARGVRNAVPELTDNVLNLDFAGQSEFGGLLGRNGRLVRVELAVPPGSERHAWVDSIVTRLRESRALSDVRIANASSRSEIELRFNRLRMAQLGIDLNVAIRSLRGAIGGVEAGELVQTDRNTRIVLRYTDAAGIDIDSVLGLQIRGVSLTQLVEVRRRRTPSEVMRSRQKDVEIVEGAVPPDGGTAEVVDAVNVALASLVLPAGAEWRVTGSDGDRVRTFADAYFILSISVLLIFLVLSVEFGSFGVALVVMLTVPLAATGSLALLWLTDQSINAVSLLGIIVMVGMADNEAVVKLAAIRKLRKNGASVARAIVSGGALRLRAILMTSVTTVTGVLPLVFGWGGGGALYRPLAAAIIGGTVSSLLVTLFVMPSAYAMVDVLRSRRLGRQ